MKIEKLPSGSYRVRKMYKGKTYSVTFEYKPTQKEALQALSDEMEIAEEKINAMTFEDACKCYIELKCNVLSPSTVFEYTNSINRYSEHFKNLRVSDMTEIDVQKEINALAEKRAPKTVQNYYGFITAVLGVYRPKLKLNITLPIVPEKEAYIPSDEEVRLLLKEITDTDYEVPIILGCFGMRRSEICGAEPKDIIENRLYINRVMVISNGNTLVKKDVAKTKESTRFVTIPWELVERIEEQGFVCNCYPGTITKHMHRIQKKLGINKFGLHSLRHYFATKMSEMYVPEADILKMGGWRTDYVMKKIYRHSRMTQNNQQAASDKLRDALYQ